MRLVNGKWIDTLALTDRAVQFGDGVFRTVKYASGGLVFWERHYRKLVADAAVLGITAPDEALLLDDIRRLLVKNRFTEAVFKIIISRGESGRGYAIPAEIQPTRIVQIALLPDYPDEVYAVGVTLRLCTIRAGWQPALAGVKHLNRLENVLARREWDDPAILEGLLLDRDGNVLEGVMSNVLARFGNELVTPVLDAGGVAGVLREVALEAARQLGWRSSERRLSRNELLAADRVWICNSLIGVMPVAALGASCWQVDAPDPLREQIARFEEKETSCV